MGVVAFEEQEETRVPSAGHVRIQAESPEAESPTDLGWASASRAASNVCCLNHQDYATFATEA